MSSLSSDVRYKRARFVTRLPEDCIYTTSHHWLRRLDGDRWQVGLTGFATRMLGDLVEFEFAARPGGPVELGRSIGWIEGFKALSDLYCVADGAFVGSNPELEQNATLFDRDPCRRGWLYCIEGQPDPAAADVHTYVAVLDATIDRMLAETPELAHTPAPGESAGENE